MCLVQGENCDAWDFFEGKCGVKHSYCAQNGYDAIVKTDGQNPFSREYAVCVENNIEIGAVSEISGVEEIAEKRGLLIIILFPAVEK